MPSPADEIQTENQEQQQTPEQLQAAWDAEVAARKSPADPVADDAIDTGAKDDAAAQAAAEAAAKKQPTAEERLAALEAANADLSNKLARESGRTSALQKKLDEKPAAAPTKAQQEAAIEDPAEWTQLMADFPEWGTAVQKKLDATMAALKKAQPAPLDANVIGDRVQAALMVREFKRVDRKHPGWRDTVKTPDFKAWYVKQPDAVKALYESDDSDDAIDMISKFKTDDTAAKAAALKDKRKATLNVAANDRTSAREVPQQAADEADPKAQWEAEKRRRAQKRASV